MKRIRALLFNSGSAFASAATLPPMPPSNRKLVNRSTDYCKCVGEYHNSDCWHVA
jgi:hypothetical protein